MLERWNTHFSTVVEQELFGVTLQLNQDPSSQNLGTTVWDASIVLAKYLEKVGVAGASGGGGSELAHPALLRASPTPLRLQNSRRGEYSRCKMRGKRALELGAGMGLAGMALAILGAGERGAGTMPPTAQFNTQQPASRSRGVDLPEDTPRPLPFSRGPHRRPPHLGAEVELTDIGAVLPLLQRNVDQNISRAALKREQNPGLPCLPCLPCLRCLPPPLPMESAFLAVTHPQSHPDAAAAAASPAAVGTAPSVRFGACSERRRLGRRGGARQRVVAGLGRPRLLRRLPPALRLLACRRLRVQRAGRCVCVVCGLSL